MDNSALKGWLVVTAIALAVCVVGWYSTANRTSGSSSSNYSSEVSSDESGPIEDYQQALSEANDNIENANDCIDDVYSTFDSGDFDEGMSSIEDCKAETVSEP